MAGRRSRGFTLIELMVVVALMAVITAVLVPFVLGRLRSRGAPERVSAPIAQGALAVEARDASGEAVSVLPEKTDVRVKLQASHEIDGFQVRTRYRAAFEGEFTLRNGGPRGNLSLLFPFPPGMTEAHGVSLDVRDEAGREIPGSTDYSPRGMRFAGEAPAGQRLVARVAYAADGRDAFVYDIAGAGRSGQIRCEIATAGVERPVIPPSSLSPTAVEPGRIAFHYDHLISSRKVIVELPPGPSPLGRVILLCQLAGLGVLLFGAGFWYLSEGQSPGRLDDFRLGHFLLLALNYVLFFALFAVLGLDGQVLAPLAIATLVSQALLSLHVARHLDLRFALSRALPLSLFTLAVVVGGVFLEPQRPLLFVGAAAVVIGYTTLTFRRWSEGRAAHEARWQKGAARRRRAEALRKLSEQLGEVVSEAELLLREAGEAQGSEAAQTASVPGLGAALDAELALTRGARSALDAVDALPDEGFEGEARPRELTALRALARLQEAHKALRGAVDEARAAQAQIEARGRLARQGARLRCIACGAATDDGQKHCGQCGVALPTPLGCAACGEQLLLPRHLLLRRARKATLRCRACGEALPPAS